MFVTRFIIGNIFSISLIGMILLFKKLLKNKVSLAFQYKIWFILLFSLTIVFVPPSFFRFAEFENITLASPLSNLPENTLVPPDMPADWRYGFTEITELSNTYVLQIKLVVLWSFGVLLVIVFYYLGNRKLKSIKRFSEPLQEDMETIFHSCCNKIAIKHKVYLLQSEMITSPLSFGYRICYIILPSQAILSSSKKEMEHMLLHELTHIKHRDLWINFWFCIVQIIYWFNPFVWWAFSKMRLDREAYCDWEVLNGYSTDIDRLSYGDTLLLFASQKNNTLILTANNLYSNKKQVRYRIERIADFKNETKRTRAFGHCFMVLFILIAMIQVPTFAGISDNFGLSYTPNEPINIVNQDYSDLFGTSHGCAIIYDLNANTYNTYHASAITQRLAPCSTYKIYSAINALEQGVITDADNSIQWDNLNRAIPSWNRDQDLNSAMKNSVNWYFQRLDQAVGADELESFYASIEYGNGYIGNNTSYYWNGSSLKISPLEQVELLVKFYKNDFGFDKENIDVVKNSIFLSQNNEVKLFGKTGTGKKGIHDVLGWFIGYVETGNNTYFFAVTQQDDSKVNGTTSIQIACSIFEKMGIKIAV